MEALLALEQHEIGEVEGDELQEKLELQFKYVFIFLVFAWLISLHFSSVILFQQHGQNLRRRRRRRADHGGKKMKG